MFEERLMLLDEESEEKHVFFSFNVEIDRRRTCVACFILLIEEMVSWGKMTHRNTHYSA